MVRDVRLRSLVIERPALAVRRDTQGRFHIGGIEFDVDAPTTNLTFVEWLARQREIVVRDARVVWQDELRGAPPLSLERVRFKLEQTRTGVRFGLVGSPPAELASPLDLRGFGRSTLPGTTPYSHAHDLAALLDHLDIPAAALVGLSKGGAVALDFALTYPRRTQALALVDIRVLDHFVVAGNAPPLSFAEKGLL